MNQTIKKRIEEIKNGIVPEGYEKTSFGIFPCDWIKVSLGEVSAKKGEYGLNAPACEYEEGLPKYLRITDIDDQGRYIDNKACVNVADSHKYVLNKGDIVFARTGASVGKNYTYDEKDGILVYAGFLIKFSIKPQYNANLICSNCRTKKYNNWVAKMCARSGQPGINAEEYATYSFIIPKSAQEQSRIAEILMQWDKAIELQEKLIEAYQKSKKYYLNKMFPTKGSNVPEIRFPGFTAPWEQRKFSELYRKVSEKNDLTYGKEDIISVANMYFKEDSYITDREYLRTYNVFLLGDIAFEGNKSKDFKHGRFVENTIGNGIVSHVFDVFRPIMGKYDLLFWKYAINNERLMGQILVRSTKASTMMTNLVAADFLNEYFLVPEDGEQKAIGKILNSIDNLITLHQQKRDKLLKQRKAMQQYLLTGIVRV